MTSYYRLVSVLWLLQLILGGSLAADQLCPRLMLTGLSEDHTAYYMFSGIYEVQDYLHNGYPVLKRANLYFSYDESGDRFVFGFEVGKMFGLAVNLQTSVNKRTWLRDANPEEPFSKILNRWFESNPTTRKAYYIDGDIRFKCIDEEYQSCDSFKMEFDTKLISDRGKSTERVLSIPGQYYYEVIPHLFHDNRAVYELKNHTLGYSMKMYYLSNQAAWVVGPAFPTIYVSMLTKDDALFPEQIVSPWKFWSNKAFRDTSAKLRCLGVTSIYGTSCNDSATSCQNNGTCHRKPSGEEICLCGSDFIGATCEKIRAKCPMIQSDMKTPGPAYFDFLNAGSVMAAVATVFCHKNYEPQYFPVVCAAKVNEPAVGEWKGLQSCSLVTTTTPPPPTTPTTRRPTTTTYNWRWRFTDPPKTDEPDWAYAVALTLGLVMQLFFPFCVYMLLEIISNRLDKSYAELKESHYGIMNKEIDPVKDKLIHDITNQLAPVEETDERRKKLLAKIEEMKQHFKEERQKVKAKRKVKNVGFCRIYSLAFNIGIWIWIPLIIVGSELDVQSDTLDALWLSGVICFPLGYLWVLMESIWCREYEYLDGLNQVEYAVEYLKGLRETAPHLVMHAECYHYETRTRTVYYTDANGNMQSRTETYQERVVTHVDSEIFRYGYWIDTSDSRFAFSHNYGVTKIKLKQAIIPGDQETHTKLSEAEDAFREKNRHYDLYMDYDLNITVDGYRKRLAAYVDPKHRSWWIGSRWFWLATFLTYSWPYRWIFRARTGNAKYKLEKNIYMTRPEQTEDINQNYTAYDVTEEQQSKICQDDKRTSIVEEPPADIKDKDKRKSEKRKSKFRGGSKKDKGKKLKTDVDIEMAAGSIKRY